jgi:hypothetical protein
VYDHVTGTSATTAPVARFATARSCTTSPVLSEVSARLISRLDTGFGATVYRTVSRTPSASAVIVTGPGRSAVTLPKRSTVATDALELVQRMIASRRSVESGCIARARCASVTPV